MLDTIKTRLVSIVIEVSYVFFFTMLRKMVRIMSCAIAFLLITTSSLLMSSGVDGGAALAAACPGICTAMVGGGGAAAAAAAVAAGIAAPLVAILVEALAGAAGVAGVGLTIAGCTTVCGTALFSASCFDEETVLTVFESGELRDVPLRSIGENSVAKCLSDNDVTFPTFTKITRIQIIEGHFDFVQLDFDDKVTSINVTAPHIMIVLSKEKGFSAKAAKDVKVGDQMLSSKTGKVLRVSKISPFYKFRKVNVETESGTLVANGLYVSGVCEHNPQIQNATSNVLSLKEFLHTYKKSHGFLVANVNWQSSLQV